MNIFGRICQFCLFNRKLAFLIFIAIIFWGLLSFWIMPKRYNPDITAPAFQITVDFPGATVQEVYELVTKPLENVVQEVPGVEDVYSRSFHGGQSVVTVNFYVGQDMDSSKIRLQQQINSNLDLKPIGVTNVLVSTLNPDDIAIMTILLESDMLDPVQLRQKGFVVADYLKMISGTAKIEVVGGQRREFQIVIDPEKLRQTKTSIDEIYAALNESSLLRTLGYIKGQQSYISVETSGLIRDVKELENLVVSSNIDRSLKIKDFAKVVRSFKETDSTINYRAKDGNFSDAVLIAVSKKKAANITVVSKSLKKRLKDLKNHSSIFDGFSYKVLRDEGRVAKEEISGLTMNLLQAITIVLITLFFFLNMRAAVVVAITVPLTLLSVIGLGHLVGFTINRITLFALILSLGLLVDSATVVVENIVRKRLENPEQALAALIASSVAEVGMGLFLSTLTTVLAFIPMRFVTGMMGPYMGPLPFFVSAAIVVSLVYSYTLTPWLAYNFCIKDPAKLAKAKDSFFTKFLSAVPLKYKSLLRSVLVSKAKRGIVLTLAGLLVLFVMTFPLLEWLKFRMLPKADREQVYVYLDLPDGSSFEQTNQLSQLIADGLGKDQDVKSVQSFVGQGPILDFNGLFKGASGRSFPNVATIRVNLTHPNDRDVKSEELAVKFRQIVGEIVKDKSGVTYQIIEDPPGPPVQSTFLVKVKSFDPDLNKKIAKDLLVKAQKIDELKDLDTSIMDAHDKYYLKVNLREAAIAQMNTGLIAQMLQTLYSGYAIGIYHDDQNKEQELITIKFDRKFRDQIEDLEHIYLTNKLGVPIQASRFLSIAKKASHETILNDNRMPTVYISGEMGERSVTYAAIDFLKILNAYNLHDGQGKVVEFSPFLAKSIASNGQEVFIEMGGEWEMTLEVFRDLGLAMLVAILLIYIVLVAQFKTYRVPLLILVTIPLALIGVFPGFAFLFWVGGIYFSATSMIGVIALAGIVVNNAIILIEYIMQSVAKGTDFLEAITESCSIRMRPIFLTSLTTILGSLAIAADPVWSGLAWSIVFGLSLSSILTLFIFPILLYQFTNKDEFLKTESCKI